MAECDHTPCPKEYLQWHEWAEEMEKTHRQIRCPHCGLWTIWVSKADGISELESTK